VKNAFTMIELIFVIVLIGILSSIAIPRLTTTRDDAETTKAAEEVRTLISDIGLYYTSHGRFDHLSKMTSVSLTDGTFNLIDANLTTKAFYSNSAHTDKCLGFQVDPLSGDLNVTSESVTSGLCRSLNNLLKDMIKVYHFGGSHVSYN